MNGAGFIYQMIKTMRDNRALMTSKRRDNRDENARRTGKTQLKFPKSDPERIKMTRRKYRSRAKAQWLLICIFFSLFFGIMLIWVFT